MDELHQDNFVYINRFLKQIIVKMKLDKNRIQSNNAIIPSAAKYKCCPFKFLTIYLLLVS